ncbi:MAG: hypothetical protein ACE5NM_06605 [Sedimentisphaerales bacterium]
MKLNMLFSSTVVLTCAVLTLVSCESLTVGWKSGGKHGHGPPPHAPAHGYRYKHQGVELVYDSGRGVYVAVEFPLHFYYKGSFYRFRNSQWEISTNIKGPWKVIAEEQLPAGLRAKEKDKSKEHPGRGLGAQKKK